MANTVNAWRQHTTAPSISSLGKPLLPCRHLQRRSTWLSNKRLTCWYWGGDIFSYPSEAAIEWVQAKVVETGLPYVYIAGNHDWHYEGMPGNAVDLRREWSEMRLKPLHQGANPLMATHDVQGIRFIVIDDSTNEILPEQLAYYTRQTAFDGPIVLVMHIPLYVPSRPITFSCGNPHWGAANDTLYTLERRSKWPAKPSEVSMEFHRRVFATPNLVGILAGHIHTQLMNVFKGIPQFVAPPNLPGGYLDVRFEPR
ncbi:MAG: hypothetical protein E2581_22630 [Pseudomonas sp.]|nr:hypothetical protein [Pseudomonas sp.]